jgi:hypothetical protein
MPQQERWQVAGNAAEIYQRALVPASLELALLDPQVAREVCEVLEPGCLRTVNPGYETVVPLELIEVPQGHTSHTAAIRGMRARLTNQAPVLSSA